MDLQRLRGHMQTLTGHFLPSATLDSRGEKILISLPDGDQLSCRFYSGKTDCIISLFHGLGGSADADYMQRTAILYLQEGHSVLLVNHRGAGEGAGLARLPYHSGRADDVSQVLGFLRQRFPKHKQIVAGFSLSGNIVLYLLGRKNEPHLPDGAITVNAPIDLHSCSRSLSRGFNRCYDLRFVQKIIQEKDLPLSRWLTLSDVDTLYTAPVSGFRDRDDYYHTCSAKPHLFHIEVPTFVLTAADDPIVPVQDYLEARWSPATRLHIEPIGGHLGYMALRKNKFGNHRWLDEYMVKSLQELLETL